MSAYFVRLLSKDKRRTSQDKEDPRRFVRIVGPSVDCSPLNTDVTGLHINTFIMIKMTIDCKPHELARRIPGHNAETNQVISPSCKIPKSRDSVRWNICIQVNARLPVLVAGRSHCFCAWWKVNYTQDNAFLVG